MNHILKRRILYFTSLIVIIIALGFLLRNYITLAQLQKYAQQLYIFTQENYFQAVLIYCLVFIIASMCFIPITVLLTIAGGFLFGAIPGWLYAISCTTIGSCLTFLFVRNFIGDLIQQYYDDELENLNQDFAHFGAQYLLILQLVPFTPTFFINLCAGLTEISLWTFAWTTLVGIAPAAFLYAWAGKSLHHVHSAADIITWPWLLLFTGIGFLLLLLLLNRKRLYSVRK